MGLIILKCTHYKTEENNPSYNEDCMGKDFGYIKDDIETTRAILNSKVAIDGVNLFDEEILELSAKLDELIVKYHKYVQEK